MLNKVIFIFLLLSFAICSGQPGGPSDFDRGFKQNSYNSAGNADQKVALLIGNSTYSDSPLLNPVNDARAMSQALRDVGFEVILRENANAADMKRAIREFGSRIQNGGTGLFYYAGHGMQVKGENYLIPINAEIYGEAEVEYEAVNVGLVLAQMENARNNMNIVILDACRNNPFAKSSRSMDKGLASINAPTGTLIAYATAPGNVAADGSGNNGLYTEELLSQIRNPGLKIEDVFKRVRANVLKRSGNQQIPWESSSLIGDFYFKSEGGYSSNNNNSNQNYNNNNTYSNQNNSNNNNANTNYAYGSNLGSSYANAEWQSDGTSYWLYVDGIAIQSETIGSWSGNDLIVYHDKTKRTYLLRNYGYGGDNRRYPAELLSSYYEAFWRATSEGYWIFYKGTSIQKETVSSWSGDDLLVYHGPSNATYLLRTYDSFKDGQLRPAEVLYSTSEAFWRTNGSEYWMYHKGNAVNSETVSEWVGDHLLVYRTTTNEYFLLRDYKNRGDNQLRSAEPIYCTNGVLWKADNTGYWLYSKGKAINSETQNEWSGDDLIVTHVITGNKYIFRDYENSKDGQLRQAEAYSAYSSYYEDRVTWRTDGNNYWLYVNDVMVTGDPPSEWIDNDLLVYNPATSKYYLLPNYRNSYDNQLRNGNTLYTTTGALWRASDAGYWLYYLGKAINSETTNEWAGENLIVNHSNSNRSYILRSYDNLKDGKLRMAELY